MSKPLVSLNDVWVVFSTPNGLREALRGVSLDIEEGEWICLLGRNGGGKSTLSRALAGLCPISKGRITVEGTPSVRMVFQNPDTQLIGETVEEDVRYQPGMGGIDGIGIEVDRALHTVNLLPHRTHPVDTLSGGQKQRLATASAIAGEAEVMVFDEATAMLDAVHRSQIWNVATRLHEEGKTVVWVTQQLDEVFLAHRVVVIEDGQVAFDGSPEPFFYPAEAHSPSPCEQLGFVPPLAVEVTRHMMRGGWLPTELPLTMEAFERSLDRP